MSLIEIKNVYKSYGNNSIVINNLSLNIDKGEFITLVGPSGCGKTTLLKMINSLVPIEQGDILVQGRSIRDWDIIELRRSIGYVVQQIGLLPHKTIEQNINFVQTLKRQSKEDKSKKAKELIKLVGLNEDYLKRYPLELSGGEKQRIGVARALAGDADIILMDEPFGAVDEIIRRTLQLELKSLHEKLNKTIIFVTHDIEEALKLGTRIIVFKDGKIVQDGTKEEIIFKPENEFVKDFFGMKGFKAIIDEDVVNKLYKEAAADIS